MKQTILLLALLTAVVFSVGCAELREAVVEFGDRPAMWSTCLYVGDVNDPWRTTVCLV